MRILIYMILHFNTLLIQFSPKFRHTQQRSLPLRKSLWEPCHMEHAFGETYLTYFRHHYQHEMNHALKVVTYSLNYRGNQARWAQANLCKRQMKLSEINLIQNTCIQVWIWGFKVKRCGLGLRPVLWCTHTWWSWTPREQKSCCAEMCSAKREQQQPNGDEEQQWKQCSEAVKGAARGQQATQVAVLWMR